MMGASAAVAAYEIARLQQQQAQLRVDTGIFPLIPGVQQIKADHCSYCGRVTHKRVYLTCEGCGAPR